MTNYIKIRTHIGRSTSEKVLLDWGRLWLQFAILRICERERVTSSFNNIYYLLSSQSNLVSLIFFKNDKIYFNNKNKTFDNSNINKILGSIQYWRKNFLFILLNFSDTIVYLTWANKTIHQDSYIYQIY